MKQEKGGHKDKRKKGRRRVGNGNGDREKKGDQQA
jgi:hypothetical protein